METPKRARTEESDTNDETADFEVTNAGNDADINVKVAGINVEVTNIVTADAGNDADDADENDADENDADENDENNENVKENQDENIEKVVEVIDKTPKTKKASKKQKTPQTKKQKTAKVEVDAEFLKKELYDESDLADLNANALKEILKAHELSSTGKKDELKARILKQIPTPPYEPVERSYEWDSSEKASSRRYILSKAKSSQANCVRCLRGIDQGRVIVCKDSWGIILFIFNYYLLSKSYIDQNKNHAIQRKYHIECFSKYPPAGTESFSDLKWDTNKNDPDLIPLVSRLFREYHPTNAPLPPRETPIERECMIAASEVLKVIGGLTGKQAIEVLKEKY